VKTARATRTAAETVHELAEHYKALRIGLSVSQTTAADTGGGRHAKPGTRLPIRLDFAAEAKRVEETVDWVARDLRAERGLPHRPVPDRVEQQRAWLTRDTEQPVCELRHVTVVTYGTVVTLLAIPALLTAVDEVTATQAVEVLEEARRDARTALQVDEPPVRLDEVHCPECFGRDLLHQALAALTPPDVDVPARPSLLALPLEGEVWCRNRACGYECARPDCWCHDDPLRRHRYRWGRADLLRLGAMATSASAGAAS
jgi:hypothetical protein